MNDPDSHDRPLPRPVAAAYANKGDLTRGPVTKHLVRLTIPMIWGLMATISFQLVNTFYISLLGTEALAAISFTFPVTYAIFSLILGMGIATSSVVSRQIGQGNPARVRRLTTHTLMLAALVGLLLAGLGIAFMDPLFRAMGAPAHLQPLIHDYMLIWFAGSLFINVPLVGNAALRAAGNARAPAMIMVAAAIVNAVIDPILIFGLLGFPALGVKGAAISTVFANICALSALLYIIACREKMLTRSRRPFRLFGDSARRLLYIALPAGLTACIQPLTAGVLTALLAGVSTEAVAAFGIASRVEAFTFIIIMALATGMAPIIGQNWGAGHHDRIRETLRKALCFAVLWSAFVALVLASTAGPLARVFSDNQEVVRITMLYFWIVTPSLILGNIVQGWLPAFNAMGMPHRAFTMIFIKMIVVTIPLCALGAHFHGVTGLFAGLAFANVTTGIVFHLRNRRLCRQKAVND